MLYRDALRIYDHADLSLRLRYSPQAVQQVGDLMRKEQACCPFLTFEMHEETDAVTLTIKAPEEARSRSMLFSRRFCHRGLFKWSRRLGVDRHAALVVRVDDQAVRAVTV